MQKEIMEFMQSHLDLLYSQTKSYQPFIKTAFPAMDVSEACFNLIAANAFSVFLGQFALRMMSPTEQDFAEFGSMVSKYKEKISELFKK